MKTTISDLVIAFFDLLEAEGRALRENAMNVGAGLGIVLLAMLVAGVAVGFFLWGIYQLLLGWFSPPVTALLMSLLALLLSFLLLGIARWLTR